MRIALLGASGYAGRLIARELDARGIPFTPVGRDLGRLEAAVTGLSSAMVPTAVDAGDRGSVHALAGAHDVLLNAVGPFVRHGVTVAGACVDAGCHYVDISAEHGHQQDLFDHLDGSATAAEVAILCGAGLQSVPGDALATIAADAVGDPAEVHVAYYVPGALAMVRRLSAGSHRSMVAVAGRPQSVVVGGERAQERLGEARRLAWFPKPVGPHHAAGTPGLEPLTLPRRRPGLKTVRTYVAMPTWQAEAAQFLGNVVRSGRVRDLLVRVTEGRSGGPGEADRAATRWACVAEASGTDGIARAWAYGHDIYGFTATSSVLLTQCLGLGSVRGVVGPADVDDPRHLLDELADRTDLRWSLVRPR